MTVREALRRYLDARLAEADTDEIIRLADKLAAAIVAERI